ncbi:MAG: UDP-N-acetylmuramate--L-alanine ligase [Solirubrobacterales bacterium]|nr:UDP-N-acetylmuramate--L-alanine ligase [Solirubrobacterales bacterium]
MNLSSERDGPGWSGRRLHFIGIGGAGMSGLAAVAHRLGAEVTGSDRTDSSYLERLRNEGLRPEVGHAPENLPEGAEVVVSTAIWEDNPELALARARDARVIHRSELLAELCRARRTVAVAGTHGKTTTTGMLVHALRELGMDPAFFVGGELPSADPGAAPVNSGWGQGDWVVVEADESDGSFLRLEPEVAVITNVEMDHHGRWSNLTELREAFRDFAAKADRVIAPANDPELTDLLGRDATRFDEASPGPDRLGLAVPGAHNRLNARAAFAALTAIGVNAEDAVAALSSFPGVRRRLEYKGEIAGTRIYDDYAHHPTEVVAAMAALRELDPERLIVVFQPHLYSRTKVFSQEFGAALAEADELIVLEVYPAREEPVGPLAGVSGLDVLREAASRNGGRPVWWAPDLKAAERAARTRLGPGRVLATIGAGDVTVISDWLPDD